MDSLFDRNIEAKDPKYVFLRDNKDRPEELAYYRDLLESYWQIFSPYADSNFKQEIAIDFDARFWEMYLVCTLISLTIPVSKRKTKGGPDICICTERNRIFFEAISPDKGSISNPDQVPEMIFGKATQVPDAEITLRLSGALREKFNKKYQHYLDTGLVKPVDAYLIAVNGFKIPSSIAEIDIPRIVKAVFPIGFPQVTIDRQTGAIIGEGHEYRPVIPRKSGVEVRTDLFVNREYSQLSGVIYSRVDIWNIPSNSGDDFVVVHNPLASNPVPLGFLKVGREYYPEDVATLGIINWGESLK